MLLLLLRESEEQKKARNEQPKNNNEILKIVIVLPCLHAHKTQQSLSNEHTREPGYQNSHSPVAQSLCHILNGLAGKHTHTLTQ